MIKKVYFEPEIRVDNTSSIPLHRQISDILQNALEHNHVEAGMRFPSILTMAKKYGLNRDTVRKAYNTLEMKNILERDQTGRNLFISSSFLEGKSRKPLTAIGIALPDTLLSVLNSSSQLPLRIVAGIMDTASLHGIASMIVPLPQDNQESCAFEQWKQDILPMLSGLIYLGESRENSHNKAFDFLLSRKDLPQVFIGGEAFQEHLGTVELDQEGAIRSVVDSLAELGHRKFALFGADIPRRQKFQLQNIDRFPLFEKEIRRHFSLPEENIFCGKYDSAEARTWLTGLLQEPQKVSAVICTGAYEARMVMETASSLGRKIPEDLSLVGYDLGTTEKIATLRYPYYQMGQCAFEIIMEARKKNLHVASLRKRLPLSLFMNNSIAPYKKQLKKG
ncbi:MAG: GntR family transcriptional regulator [Lentisphaeria bacterium]|nr:GntR family transcriptional regulator [Lentisphaeria bacterium]